MSLRVSELLAGRIYSRSALVERGAHTRDLASPALLRVMPGCYTRADAPAPLAEIARVLQRHVVPGAVISHQSAAEILGLPLRRELTRAGGALLHCSVVRSGTPRPTRYLVVHPREVPMRCTIGPLLLSHPVLVVQELSGLLRHDELVIALDAIAGGQGPLAPMPLAEIRAVVDRLGGRGALAVRRALPFVRERVWSPMETRTRLLLVREGLPEPVPNLEVVDPVTGRRFVIDLAYERWRIAIEYDGDEHRQNRSQWQKDLHKNEVLHQLGWAVLRISIADLRDPAVFLRRLRVAITERSGEQTGRHQVARDPSWGTRAGVGVGA